MLKEQRRFEPSPVRRARLAREAEQAKTSTEIAENAMFISSNPPPKSRNLQKNGIKDLNKQEESYLKACKAAGINVDDNDENVKDVEKLEESKTNVEDSEDIMQLHEKKAKSLRKKLKQIKEIKAKDLNQLNDDQKEKLSKESYFLSELEEVEKVLNSLSL